MRQWVFEDSLVRVALVDELLEITSESSYSDRTELLRAAKSEQEYIDQLYRSLDLIRKGAVTEESGDTVKDYQARSSERDSLLMLYFLKPVERSWAIWDSGTFRGTRKVSYRLSFLCCPIWIPLIVLPVYPALVIIRGPYRRHRRHKKGLCLKCGYNLTGNVSGVCPECGRPIRMAEPGKDR